MEYIELTAAVAASDAEYAASVLHDATGEGAWIEAAFTQPDLESDAIVDRVGSRAVHVYVRDAAAEATARAALAAEGIAAEIATRRVAEEDWAEAWKEQFHVERFGARIVIVPSWRTYEALPDDVVIALDPGMAFGTGQHETTRMCLEALESLVRPGMRVLDVGCGSGILSLAAAKLGARNVLAVDIDDVCVRVTQENTRDNGLDDTISAAQGSAGDMWPFAEPAPGEFDVVVANIIARVITSIAAQLVDALAPGGTLVLSGIIGEREQEVADALGAAGARVVSVRAMGDWRCITMMSA